MTIPEQVKSALWKYDFKDVGDGFLLKSKASVGKAAKILRDKFPFLYIEERGLYLQVMYSSLEDLVNRKVGEWGNCRLPEVGHIERTVTLLLEIKEDNFDINLLVSATTALFLEYKRVTS